MKHLSPTLQLAASHLKPHRDVILEAWILGVVQSGSGPETEVRPYCTRTLDALLRRLAAGQAEGLLEDEAQAAAEGARTGASFLPLAASVRLLSRCCLPYLLPVFSEASALAEVLVALGELASFRFEILLAAQEEESGRRLIEAQEQAARAGQTTREISRANEALRQSEAQSRHRAEQISLLASVARRIAPVQEPERLMQEAAESIQARLGHTYVAVVVLDDEGVLVGRWAGRPGVGRSRSGRAQGPPGGVIGRAIRLRAPQVVADVGRDPDYHPDVPGTSSEMVIPLLDGGAAVGAIDFQSPNPAAFDLDDVAAGEALAEFLVVAMRNARLLQEARRRQAPE